MIWLVIRNMIRMVDRISENQRGADDQTFFCCPGCNYLWQFPHRTGILQEHESFLSLKTSSCSWFFSALQRSESINDFLSRNHPCCTRKTSSLGPEITFISLIFCLYTTSLLLRKIFRTALTLHKSTDRSQEFSQHFKAQFKGIKDRTLMFEKGNIVFVSPTWVLGIDVLRLGKGGGV